MIEARPHAYEVRVKTESLRSISFGAYAAGAPKPETVLEIEKVPVYLVTNLR